jgi:hypothetical protein
VLPSEIPSLTLQDLFLHKEVVEYVHTFLPVIPMRFPTTLKGRNRVIEFLQGHSALLEETLDRLEDKVEISLRVIPEEKAVETAYREPRAQACGGPGEISGIEYLRQKRQIQEEGQQFGMRAQEVYRVLGQKFAHLVVESQLETKNSMFSIYYLVRRSLLEEFERVFREIKGDLPERVLYSGPWPPYSFVPEFLEV